MRIYADPTRTWATPHPTQKGFVLHDTQEPRYLNGGDHSLCNNQMSHPGPTYPASSLFNQTQATSASPQHRNAVSIPISFAIIFSSCFLSGLTSAIRKLGIRILLYLYSAITLSCHTHTHKHTHTVLFVPILLCIQCTHHFITKDKKTGRD